MGDNIWDFLTTNGWPIGLQSAILGSKRHVAFRFIVVDNSRSMIKRESYDVMSGGLRTRRYYNRK
jgi:hypothetical protein